MLEAEPDLTEEEILERVLAAATATYAAKVDVVGKEAFSGFERSVMLQSIDSHWREHLAALDAKAEQPLRSSLVISQGASRLPRTGFFECVERLGRFCGPSDGVAAASWHASEVVRVFEYEYPESAEA